MRPRIAKGGRTGDVFIPDARSRLHLIDGL